MPSDNDVDAFLRAAHIFSNTVRTVLEERLLRETAGERLTFPHFNVLKLLGHRPARHIGEVAQFLGVSYPAASKIVDRLHQLGLLTRREDPADRRASCLELTATGTQLVEDYDRHKRDVVRDVLSDQSPAQIAKLSARLEGIAARLLEGNPCDEICTRCGAHLPAICVLTPHTDCVHVGADGFKLP